LPRAKHLVEHGPNGRPRRPAKPAAKITPATLTVTKNQACEITNLGISTIEKLIKNKVLKTAPIEGVRRVNITMASIKAMMGITTTILLALVTTLVPLLGL
jgi:hypothetical protein